MRHTKNILLAILWGASALSVLIVVLFETDILEAGWGVGRVKMGFYAAVVMELLTICVVPLSLRLFKFTKIRTSLHDGGADSLARWGSVRMLMLCLPMVINVVCYYLFMNVAFAYMAIILFLCLFFVYPTMERCLSETGATSVDNTSVPS